ncbi:MAG: hypothetical protein GAK28_04746 [Luteibacter sp.]|uniref:hypothetical protein n=1 Tax=Luteibacter sp. TaxID=1886636 RepID=UPI0013824F4E|nr:hypothetical protein [Luteibacter sp.]KAF1003385.1 MAG: hypothetical protein GAK28_04746 [Luteibacter sp.]
MPHSIFTRALPVGALAFAVASAPAQSTGTARFTGPLVTPAVNTLPSGLFNIEPYLIHSNSRGDYDNTGGRHVASPQFRQWQIAVPMSYGITDSFGIQVTPTAARTSGGGRHTDGLRLGDTGVRLQQRLLAPDDDGGGTVLAVAVARNFTTGKYHQLDANPLNATGSGAARTTLAVGAQRLHWLEDGRALRWRSQVAWSPRPDRIRVRDASVYGTDAGLRGYATPGQSWSATFAAEYALDSRWVLVGEAIWNHNGAIHVRGVDARGGSIDHRLASGHAISLAPAVEYHFNANVGLIAGVQFTVAGRNVTDYVAPQAAVNMVF